MTRGASGSSRRAVAWSYGAGSWRNSSAQCADIWRVDEDGRVMVLLGRFGQIQEGPLFELPDEEDYERGTCPECFWEPYLRAARMVLYS